MTHDCERQQLITRAANAATFGVQTHALRDCLAMRGLATETLLVDHLGRWMSLLVHGPCQRWCEQMECFAG